MNSRFIFEKLAINLIIDTTECSIQRNRNKDIQRIFFSGKKKKHTIKYEIGVNIINGFIHWIWGPVPGTIHDFKIVELSGIVESLEENERILGDKAYVGNDCIITPLKKPQTEIEFAFNSVINRWREKVEHTIGRLKAFNCLTVPWRHDISLHSIVFNVISQIVNIELHFQS